MGQLAYDTGQWQRKKLTGYRESQPVTESWPVIHIKKIIKKLGLADKGQVLRELIVLLR